MPDQKSAQGPRELAEFGVLRAAGRYWYVMVLTLLVFIGAGVAVGLLRTPVYTSQIALNVSFTAESVATQPGAVDAAQNLAESYARSIYADDVVKNVADETKLDRPDVRGAIRATPVTDSTVLVVYARSADERQAERIAQAAADGLVDYVQNLGGAKLRDSQLFERFQEANRNYQELLAQRDEEEKGRGTASVDLETEVSEAKLEADTYAQLYRGTQRPVVAPLEVLEGTREASSDFMPRLQLLIVVGVVGGLLAGVALTSLLAARRRRKDAKAD